MGLCWKCGKKESKKRIWGYPVCEDHTEDDIDPEIMELVVIKSFERGGDIIPLDVLLNEIG